MSEVWYAAAVKPLTYRMPAKFRVEGWHVLLSISAEPGPGISVQSRPTLAVEQRSSPESTEGTRARRAAPSQATERRAWGGAVGRRGRSAGHGP